VYNIKSIAKVVMLLLLVDLYERCWKTWQMLSS